MHYREFSVFSSDGHRVRIREIWRHRRGDGELSGGPTYSGLGFAVNRAVTRLRDGRFKIDGKVYSLSG